MVQREYSVDTQLSLYKSMLQIRLAEEKIRSHYHENQMKTPVHLSIGAESIGAALDYVFPEAPIYGTYRNHHLFLARTKSAELFFSELLGLPSSPLGGKAGSMHLCAPQHQLMLTSAVVGTTIPTAVGAAWATQKTTICVLGDGATEEGVFFESLNFAKLKACDVLFTVEDNDLAIHSFKQQRQAFSLDKLAAALNIHYAYCDSKNIYECLDQLTELKKIKGPKIWHTKYFRNLEHVGISEDFNFGYRQKPSSLKELDPIDFFENFKSTKISVQQMQTLKSEVQLEIDSAYQRCLNQLSQTQAGTLC